MRPITLTIDAPPPLRHDDGVCADRSSPNAEPLFGTATALVAADPEAFPVQQYVLLTITSSEPLPDTWREHGYSVPTAIIEVLVDARLLEDEDQGERVVERIEPGIEVYSIQIEESRTAGYSIGPSGLMDPRHDRNGRAKDST